MKKIIFPVFLLLLATNSNAQKIQVTSNSINVGQVQYFVPTNCIFEMKNVGNKPLIISHIDTGCGCTVASFPNTPIKEGSTFTINVSFDARMMGHFTKLIDVYSNSTENPTQLELSGVVVEEIQDFTGDFPFKLGNLIADCNEIVFEDVHVGERIQQKFHIYNPTDKIVQPQIMHLPAYLKAEVSPSKVAPKRSAEIILTLDSRFVRDLGYETTQIFLGSNPGEKVSQSKQLNISAIILPGMKKMTDVEKLYAPKITISNTEVKMPILDGKKKTETVNIENVGKTRLEIKNIQMLTTGLQVELNKTSLDSNESAKLKITTNPKQLKNLKSIPRILLITNDPENPKIFIDVDIN